MSGTSYRSFIVAGLVLAGSASFAAQSAKAPKGIFVQHSDGRTTAIKSTSSGDVHQEGIGKSIMTQGIMKPSMTVRHANASAEVTIAETQPTFVFRLQPGGYNDPSQMMEAMSSGAGYPPNAESPKKFALAKMTVDGDSRVLDSKKMKKYKFTFEEKDRSTHEFVVHVAEPLDPGEYAFFIDMGQVPTQIWAFSVHPAKP